ncbi:MULTISPECIES: hypothetical protein [unclassified Bradyrhizobium]|uniref:hypothetical protein n=1 Tax=unclassified Bradyrhizobium TaxID=2631580 RepID=UPI001FFB9D72|nr:MULTISPECIES: hypothetical protein [unclassified Bradyrhizobium]MCK1712943.1 hypothetical protein [Bradyrhizobium sp. 143]MCK1728987.1 hypothetical protein [Bradyrhizobium sp. 142]
MADGFVVRPEQRGRSLLENQAIWLKLDCFPTHDKVRKIVGSRPNEHHSPGSQQFRNRYRAFHLIRPQEMPENSALVIFAFFHGEKFV